MYRCKQQHASCPEGQITGPIICYLLLCMQPWVLLLTAYSRKAIIARHSSCMGIVCYCIDPSTGCCQVEVTQSPRSLLSTNIYIYTWPSCPSCFCTQWRTIGIFNGVSYLFQHGISQTLFLSVDCTASLLRYSCKCPGQAKLRFTHSRDSLSPWTKGAELLFRQDVIIKSTHAEMDSRKTSVPSPVISP